MQSSPNMNLTLWDDLDDPYDHTELVTNWQKVDDHDHTATNGVQIPTGGLVNSAVTNAKLAPDAVTTSKILNGTILGEDLADGAIGIGQVDQDLFSAIVPLGVTVPWFRPNTGVGVPDGWHIADGSVIAEGSHGWGVGGVTIPDLRNKFVLGAATSGTGTGVGTPPAENTVGGAHNKTFPHTHTVAGHTHTVNAHSHTVNAHTHVGPVHSHSISGDGGHTHNTGQAWRGNSNVRGNQPGIHDYPEAFAFQNHGHTLDAAGFHNHGGSTGSGSGTTQASSPGTSDASPGTSSTTLTTDSGSGGGDIRPAFVGLLYITKVKNPE